MIKVEISTTVTIDGKDFETLSKALEITRRCIDARNYTADFSLCEIEAIKKLSSTIWDR